jgi:hypothetical protein
LGFLFISHPFSKPFQTFKFFQTLLKPKHFKLFSNFQIILKTFKTSHQQTINTMQPKDDAQALIASEIIQKGYLNILEPNLIDNLFIP